MRIIFTCECGLEYAFNNENIRRIIVECNCGKEFDSERNPMASLRATSFWIAKNTLFDALESVARGVLSGGEIVFDCAPDMNIIKATELLQARSASINVNGLYFGIAVKLRKQLREQGAKALGLADSDALIRWLGTSELAGPHKERLNKELSCSR